MLTWVLRAVLLAAAVVVGRATAAGLSDHLLAVALSFAGGAFATAGGFFLSFVLAG